MRFTANQYEVGYINELKTLMSEISDTISNINEIVDDIPYDTSTDENAVVYDTAAASSTENVIENEPQSVDDSIADISKLVKSMVAKHNRAKKLVETLFDPNPNYGTNNNYRRQGYNNNYHNR